MAISFVAASTADTDVNAGPPGSGGVFGFTALPTGYTTGDLLLVCVVDDDNSGPGAGGAAAVTAGWNRLLLGTAGNSVGSSGVYTTSLAKMYLYYKIAASAAETVPTFPMSGTAYPTGLGRGIAGVAAYRGVDKLNPFSAPALSAQATSTALVTANSLDTGGEEWVLFFRTSSAIGATTTTISQTSSTGWTNVYSNQSTTATPATTSYLTMGWWHSGAVAAGSYAANSTATTSATIMSSVWGQIALRPDQCYSKTVNYAQQIRQTRW